MHLPEMFSQRELRLRDKFFRKLARMSTALVLSSECAKNDFLSFLPDYKGSVALLQFVAQIPKEVYDETPWDKLRHYGIPKKFIYLPSQYWKHKNHVSVIKALKILKDKNKDFFVVCTGNQNDYRNPGHFDFLKKEIHVNGLAGQIALLGLVPLDHLYAFMRQSLAILNPSLFEGWSTTVEEAKSLGKKVLLSDIPVHKEQAPPAGVYFDPQSPEQLADKMLETWENTPSGPDWNMEERARAELPKRVKNFADEFTDILKKAVSDKTTSYNRLYGSR